MKRLIELKAPQALLEVCWPGVKFKTVWRECNDGLAILWVAEHAGVEFNNILAGLCICAEQLLPFIPQPGKQTASEALKATRQWLIDSTTPVLPLSRAVAQLANEAQDKAEEGDEERLYGIEFALSAAASVSYCTQDREHAEIALSDCIMARESLNLQDNTAALLKSCIKESSVRLALLT